MQQLNSEFRDSFDRNDCDTTVEMVPHQHLVNVVVRIHESVLMAKQLRALLPEIAHRR
jgi:hypothetical protein